MAHNSQYFQTLTNHQETIYAATQHLQKTLDRHKNATHLRLYALNKKLDYIINLLRKQEKLKEEEKENEPKQI